MNDTLRARAAVAFGDGYEVDAEIGRGGMGVVYRCRDVKLRRFVAIKVLPPDLAFRDEVRTRFLREAETAAQLNHPNIVPIYSVDDRDGLVWFVMGLVDGESLGSLLAVNPRPDIQDVRRILHDVADALAYAHSRGIIHRDIKPDNILIDRLTRRPIVTDFGIARAIEGDSRLTVTGTAVGTPAYMSPEQAMGEGEIDGRSDLYSLAVVGYQMLAGELPFKATNTPAMLMKHLSDPLRPLRSVRSDIPPGLAAVVERCLEKKPAHRWHDAGEFRDALEATASEAAPEGGSRAHLSAAWKRPAVAPPPLPVPALPADPEPPVRLPRLTQRGRSERGGTVPGRSVAAFPGTLRSGDDRFRDDQHPVPAFMPESWKEARREWSRQAMLGRADRRPRSREARIRDFRHSLARTAVTVTAMGAMNMMFSPGVPWFLIPTAFMSLRMLRRAGSLWADGIRIRDVLGRRAADHLASEDRSPMRSPARPPSTEDMARQLASPEVLSGKFGDTVRRAVSDRAAAQDALARLAPADRELIPDVGPTLEALAQRVASLAQALHGLETAAAPEELQEADRKLEETRLQPESPERDKRIAMLERKRQTLNDLLERRDGLREQLESASLMLQSMRLDLLALGSAGVQSALNDATTATQEARALSRDLRIVLDAAKEIRTQGT